MPSTKTDSEPASTTVTKSTSIVSEGNLTRQGKAFVVSLNTAAFICLVFFAALGVGYTIWLLYWRLHGKKRREKKKQLEEAINGAKSGSDTKV
ncbi:uncharacterized protein IL334_007386 [Kwoniella shivajii]|uniref:Uncharacterized protein n=1 Tax=Kwoniella shivajii TaxID=564305 RepID=A0ABZ1D8I2_9TREE|nr:hypothetical protein IL334_007386 [Kwoniella shivajii]